MEPASEWSSVWKSTAGLHCWLPHMWNSPCAARPHAQLGIARRSTRHAVKCMLDRARAMLQPSAL
jgi:hypothetical protein